MIKKVMISIDGQLHEGATQHAKQALHSTFSGYVTRLIVDDIGPSPSTQPPQPPTAADMLRAKAAAKKQHDAKIPKDNRSKSGR